MIHIRRTVGRAAKPSLGIRIFQAPGASMAVRKLEASGSRYDLPALILTHRMSSLNPAH